MPLLIDCYNVLHESKPSSLAGLDEAGLCRLLGRSRWAGQRIVLVCDGRAKPLGLTESPVDEVDLLYSGVGRTADDLIIELIERDTAPRRLIVVSSDHVIQRAARRRRATAWDSARFLHELLLNLAPASSDAAEPIRPTGLSQDEVTQWLKEFGVETGSNPYPPHKNYKKPPR